MRKEGCTLSCLNAFQWTNYITGSERARTWNHDIRPVPQLWLSFTFIILLIGSAGLRCHEELFSGTQPKGPGHFTSHTDVFGKKKWKPLDLPPPTTSNQCAIRNMPFLQIHICRNLMNRVPIVEINENEEVHLFRACNSRGVSYCLLLDRDSKSSQADKKLYSGKWEGFRYALIEGCWRGGAVGRLPRGSASCVTG